MSERYNLEDSVSLFECVSIVFGCTCSSCHMITVGFIQGQSGSSSHLFNKLGWWLTGSGSSAKGNWGCTSLLPYNCQPLCTLRYMHSGRCLLQAGGCCGCSCGCSWLWGCGGNWWLYGLCIALVAGAGRVAGATSLVVPALGLMVSGWHSQMW